MAESAVKYAYFPGCLDDDFTREGYVATKKVAEKIGVKLVEIPEFSCCGAGVVRDSDDSAEIFLNARNFALAEQKNLDIVTTCGTCLLAMSRAKAKLDEDKALRSEINEQLAEFGLKYSGKVWIKHWLWVLGDEIELKSFASKPLKKIRVAPYYGCHILRPSKLLRKQEPDNPETFEKIISAIGAEAVDYKERKDCCGFHGIFANSSASLKSSGKILEAIEGKADCISTVCSFCHCMLDALQPEARKASGLKENSIPVLHLSQLVGLALGIPSSELGLNRNVSSVNALLEKTGNTPNSKTAKK